MNNDNEPEVTDLPPGYDDQSHPEPTKPLVKGVEVERGEWTYAVLHEDVTAIVGPWQDAYTHAQSVATIQAMVLDALGGSRG